MGCGLSFGCCSEQDFLETDFFEVRRVIHPLPMHGPGTIVTPVTGGTLHGLLYGEVNLNGHPIEQDPHSYDEAKDPHTILQPYADSFCLSYRFRKRFLTIGIITPWAANGTLPPPSDFNVGISIFLPWGPRTKIIAASIATNRWQWARIAGLPTEIFAIATPTSEYDDDPSRKYEQALGTKPRGLLARAPIFTLSGGQVNQGSTPQGSRWGELKLIGARGFEAGQTIISNTDRIFQMKIDMQAWEQDEADATGEPFQNWYGVNGAFVSIQSFSLPASGDMAPFANSHINYTVRASAT